MGGGARPGAGGDHAQKKSLIAVERDEAARAAWRADAAPFAPADLLFLDETASNVAMTPRYARAPRGTRVYGAVPRNRGRNVTLIATLSTAGLGAAMTIAGALDGPAFAAYVRAFLAPTLRPGQIVVRDNLAVHRDATARRLIEARGCQLLFLPAYSPDFSPIEHAFGKLKEHLRRAGARTRDALEAAIAAALDTVTPQDAAAWFRHCGYPLDEAQPLC